MNTSQPITTASSCISGTTTRWYHFVIMRAPGSDNIVDGMGPVGSHHIRRTVGGSRLGAMTLQGSRECGRNEGRGKSCP